MLNKKDIKYSIQEGQNKSYDQLVAELQLLQQKIDKLQTFSLKKIDGGNLYLKECEELKGGKQFKKINVPAYCKMFSISSCTSRPFAKLTEPYQNIGLQLFDKQGRRQVAVSHFAHAKKIKVQESTQ